MTDIFFKLDFPSGLENSNNTPVYSVVRRKRKSPSPVRFLPGPVRESLVCNSRGFIKPFHALVVFPEETTWLHESSSGSSSEGD